MSKQYTHLELFAGAGGLILGFEKAGIKTETAIEMDRHCCDTLRNNFPKCHVIEDKIENVDFQQFSGVDIISGGFPCQPFSHAGERRGLHDDRLKNKLKDVTQ